jgi:hypothetical protein
LIYIAQDSPQRLPPTKKQQLISEKPIAEQRELLGLLSGSTKGEEQLSSSITKLSSSNPTATLQQQQEEEEESESDGAHSQSDSPSGETNNESGIFSRGFIFIFIIFGVLDGFERLADIESDS